MILYNLRSFCLRTTGLVCCVCFFNSQIAKDKKKMIDFKSSEVVYVH